MMNRRKIMVSASAALVGSALSSVAFSQAFPNRPIRIVVPYAPGGTTDIVGRRVGQRLSEVLGQAVVIENRAGGNTAIGVEAVAKAPRTGTRCSLPTTPLLWATLHFSPPCPTTCNATWWRWHR